MERGNTLILQPRDSDTLVRHRTYISNSFKDIAYYTDGYFCGPNTIPIDQGLRRVISSGRVFLPIEAEVFAEQIDPLDRPDPSEEDPYDWVPYDDAPSEADFDWAIKNLVSATDPDDEITLQNLRNQFWWHSNHPIRHGVKTTLSDLARKNMEKILESIEGEKSEYHRMLRAELLRELGDYEGCSDELINYKWSDTYNAHLLGMFGLLLDQSFKVEKTWWKPFPA